MCRGINSGRDPRVETGDRRHEEMRSSRAQHIATEPANPQAPFSPVFPPLPDAPAIGQERLHSPTRRAIRRM
jgi:hypothetical protein